METVEATGFEPDCPLEAVCGGVVRDRKSAYRGRPSLVLGSPTPAAQSRPFGLTRPRDYELIFSGTSSVFKHRVSRIVPVKPARRPFQRPACRVRAACGYASFGRVLYAMPFWTVSATGAHCAHPIARAAAMRGTSIGCASRGFARSVTTIQAAPSRTAAAMNAT